MEDPPVLRLVLVPVEVQTQGKQLLGGTAEDALQIGGLTGRFAGMFRR